MTCRLLSLSSEAMWPELLRLLENRDNPDQTVETDVRAMLDAVRKGGDSAVLEYVRRFDCPDMRPPLRVPAEDLEQAARDIPAESLDCIKQAADNIRAFHEAQKDRSWFLTRDDGTILGQKIEAVDRAGLYVPGGRGGNTPLISSLLMTAIPAQAAGVREIAVVTPPRADGTLNPHILAAAYLLGVHEIYRMGGAWAIAALAYGTETVAPVDVIAGPGNIWVTTAKRLVQGRVGIDMIAGPSEVLVLADDSANPEWLAADMLSQAEHDALASAICITDNEALAHAVIAELERQSATLPRADGTLNPHILAAAHLLGVHEIYRMGGAWAIAALAYGTETVAPVDVIAGPGNIWVTTAKRLVQGRVGIDMIAGPSEVLVLADDSANPEWLAADMLSQAEHDALASAICITDNEALAHAVIAELERQSATLPRADIVRKSLADWSAVVLVPDMDAAIALANRVAPEHLEVLMREPWSVLPRIRHAGAVFLGPYAPEPLGDYFAGPNHVLPTLGTARFSSALSVQTFCKRTSIIAASPAFAAANADAVARLARMEQLEAHARSMECRKQ